MKATRPSRSSRLGVERLLLEIAGVVGPEADDLGLPVDPLGPLGVVAPEPGVLEATRRHHDAAHRGVGGRSLYEVEEIADMPARIGRQAIFHVSCAQTPLKCDVKNEHGSLQPLTQKHTNRSEQRFMQANPAATHRKNIRVAQVAPTIFPVPPKIHGGTERVIHDLSIALRDLGVEVTLLAPSDSATDVRRVGIWPSLFSLETTHGTVPPSIPPSSKPRA